MRKLRVSASIISIVILIGLTCCNPDSYRRVLTAELPLHLEEHIDEAKIGGSEVADDVHEPVEWRFDEPQPDWKAAGPIFTEDGKVSLEPVEDALRIHFTEKANRTKISKRLNGSVYVDLPDWRRDDWSEVIVCARNSDPFLRLTLDYNLGERLQPGLDVRSGILFPGDRSWLISDGEVNTYKLSVDVHRPRWGEWKDPWRQLVLTFVAPDPGSLDLLSVSVIPKEYIYADAPVGIKTVEHNRRHKRTLYTHAPGRIEYRVKIPQAGRLDFGLGLLSPVHPVTFRIVASQSDEKEEVLFEETYANHREWAQRTLDLSGLAGKTTKIALETDAERAGTVALWSAPTLTGRPSFRKPNIILYIIDGAGVDDMSVYGYNRRTTPNIERLAAEGAVFEHAYSNNTWTRVSNPSFLTSLYHSVLGGYTSNSDPLPDQVVTLAEHMHRGGYMTARFTTNAYAGAMASFDRGVDNLRDGRFNLESESQSSEALHRAFWSWREAYPGKPYWTHIQTTDIHGWIWEPVPPFAGLFLDPEKGNNFPALFRKLRQAVDNPWEVSYTDFWEKTGMDRVSYSNIQRGLYDETLAHNDHHLGRLVQRLKDLGEWENTLFIIAADHGHKHAGRPQLDPLPPKWGSPLFASFCTRIPMIFIWEGKIAPGQRLSQPVSMIDMLPTILDLAGLPMPDVMQGQSLAPLLLGEEGWEQRPVIFDEFYVDEENGELSGNIEVVDGRWGASLRIGTWIEQIDSHYQAEPRPHRLLLYDIWEDPYCLVHLNDEHPDLVEKYTKFLEEQWEAHQALGKLFSRSGKMPLTPEQIETLRSLGYIR